MAVVVVLVLGLLILAMAGHSSANWCVCKQGLSDAVLQKSIDFACGAGADCNPIRPNGQCYNPDNVRSHCSYAVNSYYQRKAASGATCDFTGTAILSSADPSVGSCAFPASAGSAGTGTGTGMGTGTTSPVTTVPSSTPTTPTSTPVTPVSGTGTTPVTGTNPTTTTSPYTTTPNTGTTPNGVLGGVGTGMAPTGSSMDDNHGIKLESMSFGSILVALVVSGIMCLWN